MLSGLCRAQLWPRNKLSKHEIRGSNDIPMNHLDHCNMLGLNIDATLHSYRRSCETLYWVTTGASLDQQSCACLSINEQGHSCRYQRRSALFRRRSSCPSLSSSCDCSDSESTISSTCSDCDESIYDCSAMYASVRRRQPGRRSMQRRLKIGSKVTNIPFMGAAHKHEERVDRPQPEILNNKTECRINLQSNANDCAEELTCRKSFETELTAARKHLTKYSRNKQQIRSINKKSEVTFTVLLDEREIDDAASDINRRVESPCFPKLDSLMIATPDNPTSVTMVIMDTSVLLQAPGTSDDVTRSTEVKLGTLVTARFVKTNNWIFVETPHGQKGYINKKACMPLCVLTEFTL